MTIRPEQTNDCDAIRRVHIAAFADHPFSHQTEHLIVDALRADGALTISLVAEIDGAVVGHVAFSPVTIGGAACDWYALGPVGVLPEFQRRGAGKAMIEAGLARLRAMGAHGCVLVGNPAYYGRFGFAHNPALTMAGVPPEVILCTSIHGETPRGEIAHHAAFSI
jgi:putative acetyltransferase